MRKRCSSSIAGRVAGRSSQSTSSAPVTFARCNHARNNRTRRRILKPAAIHSSIRSWRRSASSSCCSWSQTTSLIASLTSDRAYFTEAGPASRVRTAPRSGSPFRHGLRGRRPLHRNQQLVAERVAVEGGTGDEPRPPTLRAAQPLYGLTGVLAIPLATLSALLVGELPPLLDGHLSVLLSWGPAGCGADPRPQGARQGATIGRGRPAAGDVAAPLRIHNAARELRVEL